MRKRKRAPVTDYAAGLILKKLDDFKNQGINPNDILNQSIENTWTGIFPLKENHDAKTNSRNNGTVLKPDEFTDPDDYFRQRRNEH
jgi:hypothetical protein